MKRKWLAIALAMSVLLSMTACGSGSGETTPAGTTAGETAEAGGETSGTEENSGVSSAELPEYNAADYVSIDNYTGVEVEVADSTVTEDEFRQAVDMLLQNYATVEQITDRETAEGDTIYFDYSGAIDGEVFQGGTATGQTTTIGQGGWIDGFEEGLVGRKCGEEFVVDTRFPDPYKSNPDLAGKEAQFTMTIHYIQGDTIVPELTDEFVKGLEDYTCGTVKEFEEVYMAQLSEQKQAYMENQALNTLWNTLLENAVFNGYPEGYVEAYTQDMVSSYTAMAAGYGMELEEFVQGMYGLDMETFNNIIGENAESQLKTELLWHYIAEKENITASEEDYLAIVQEYMEYYGYSDMTSFVNAFGVDNVEAQGYADALFQNVLDFCYENAVKVPASTEAETNADETAAAE